jgi:hypothetical protein
MPDFGDADAVRYQAIDYGDPDQLAAQFVRRTPQQQAEFERDGGRIRNRALLPLIFVGGGMGISSAAMGGGGVASAAGGASGGTGVGATAPLVSTGFGVTPYAAGVTATGTGAGAAGVGSAAVGGGLLASTPTATGLAPYAGTATTSGIGAAGGGGLMSTRNIRRAQALGTILGGAAQGSAQQRMGENQQALLQAQFANRDTLDRASLQSANANTRASMANDNATTRASMQNTDNQFRAGLDLQRKQFTQNEPNVQARQALTGSLMSRIQPMRAPSGFEQRPSILDAIGPEAREAGNLLAQRGLSGLQSGPSQFVDIPGVSLPELTLPEVLNLPPAHVAAMQKSELLEKIMGGFGIAGSAVGALGDLRSVDDGGRSFNNAMPTPSRGFDQYGNSLRFTLPRADFE